MPVEDNRRSGYGTQCHTQLQTNCHIVTLNINSHTICDPYSLPLIPDLIAKLQGVTYFTKLNLC